MSSQGERIKKVRMAMGLSQEEFGKLFGISKQYVYSLEKDKLALNNEKLVKLLVDYDVNINYILAGFGNMFEHVDKQPQEGTSEYNSLKLSILQDVRNMLKAEGWVK